MTSTSTAKTRLNRRARSNQILAQNHLNPAPVIALNLHRILAHNSARAALLLQQHEQRVRVPLHAARVLEKAASATPDSADVQLAQAAAFASEKQYDKATELVDAAAAKQADHAELPYYRGMLAVLKKQYKEAVPQLETAIKQDAENAYAYYYAGLAYSNTKRPDKMVESFNNFLRLEPKAPEAAKVRSFLKSSR